jgi:hypothetical protein
VLAQSLATFAQLANSSDVHANTTPSGQGIEGSNNERLNPD